MGPFFQDKRQKSVAEGLSETITIVELSGEMPVTEVEQPEPMNSDVLTGVVDIVLNSFDGPVISEFETPNVYINSLPQTLPENNCFNNTCAQVGVCLR